MNGAKDAADSEEDSDASSIGYQFYSGMKEGSSSGTADSTNGEADSSSNEADSSSEEADSGSGTTDSSSDEVYSSSEEADSGIDEEDSSSEEADSGSSESDSSNDPVDSGIGTADSSSSSESDSSNDPVDSGIGTADSSTDETDRGSSEADSSSVQDNGSSEADSSDDEEESNASSDSEQLQLQESIQESGSRCDEKVIHPQQPANFFFQADINATGDISAPGDSEQLQDFVEESWDLNELPIEAAPAPQLMDQAMALPDVLHCSTSGCVNVVDVDSAHKDRTEPSKPCRTKHVDHSVQGQSKAKQAVSDSQTPDRRKRTTVSDQFQLQNASAKESDSSDGLGRLRNDVGEPPPVGDTQDFVRAENECVDVSREGELLHLLGVHMEPHDSEILQDLLPPHDEEDQEDHEDPDH